MDASEQILKIQMPSMQTGKWLLLLVGAAFLALWWWVQRWHAQELWLQGELHCQAFEMGCRCYPRRPYFPPASLHLMFGGEDAGGHFEELPLGAVRERRRR